MTEGCAITIKNRLITDKRDINIYHQSTRSAHIISHHSSITLPLRTVGEDDYLHISVGRSPGDLWRNCLIDVPSWSDFEFSSEGNVNVIHSGGRTLVKIPPGPPNWEIKITRPNNLSPGVPLNEDNVTIGDDESVWR